MGTTFVQIDDRGFWMRDNVLQLWLRLLALNIPEPKPDDSEALQIRNQWLLASTGYFTGCVPDGLPEAVATPTGKQTVIRAVDALMAALSEAPPTLDKGFLNLLGFEDACNEGFEVWRLVQVGTAFRDLIDGKITSTAESTEFMPGSMRREESQPVDAPDGER
jgi:hypothetical protein